MSDDYDSPWKDALQRYFPEFMSFYFPKAFAEIDWSVPCAFLNQELAQVSRDAEIGRRRVDMLVRVARPGGGDHWVLIHVDVQGSYDREFAERIFVYNYRIYDRYRKPVASLAVLADRHASWKPNHFRTSAFGCEIGIRFPIVKLGEFAPHLDQLLEHDNAFALVTAAHLLTQQTRKQAVKRYAAKWKLSRLLYERMWARQRIIDLLNVIDWMMAIPSQLQDELSNNIDELERKLNMPYMNSFERRGREQGAREVARKLLTIQLEKRFGALAPSIQDLLDKAKTDELVGWATAVVDAPSIEQVFSPRSTSF
jgi:hypothetical protein